MLGLPGGAKGWEFCAEWLLWDNVVGFKVNFELPFL